MESYKVRFISDNVHGSIPYSGYLERHILANPLFNRLQSIKQNSTAFKTYPSLEYSRFTHSLGSMQIASDLFYSGILNSSHKIKNEFFSISKEYINLLLDSIGEHLSSASFYSHYVSGSNLSTDHMDNYSASVNKIKKTIFSELRKTISKDSLFSMYRPDIENNDLLTSYYLIFQALRVSALFHDLGHPPFSHAVEFAISDFYNLKKNCKELSSFEKTDFYKIITDYIQFGNSLNLPNKLAFHEAVSLVFINFIFENFFSNVFAPPLFDKENIVKCYYIQLIKILSLSIYSGYSLTLNSSQLKYNKTSETDNFNSIIGPLHSLISSSFDSDRLDFVLRDGINSGFSKQSYNITRLIKNYTLIYNDNKNKNYFIFSPSIRALNDVEKFFRERLTAYKYITFHHNVVKTDLILYKCIINILNLAIEDSKNGQSNEHYLIWSNFWQLLKLPVPANSAIEIEKFINRASSWTEDWLSTAINNSYIKLHDENISANHKTNLSNEKKYLYSLIKEFIFNRRNLLSLWKKNHSYNDFVVIISKNLIKGSKNIISLLNDFHKSPKKKEFKKLLGPSYLNFEHKLTSFTHHLTILDFIKENPDYPDSMYIQYKYQLVKNLIEICSILEPDFEIFLEKKLSRSFKKILNKNDVLVFVKVFANRLKTGIIKTFELSSTSDHSSTPPKSEFLKNVSSVCEELELTTYYSPQFYIYITYSNHSHLKFDRPSEISENDLRALFLQLSSILFNKFKSFFKNV